MAGRAIVASCGLTMTDTGPKQTDFGYRRVPLDDKQAMVDDVFRSVARRYDLMNDLMSFGLHRAWKDALVTAIDPPRQRPFALLDIAGGTGDVAFRTIAAGGEQTRATVCDINADMLAVGRERATARGLADAVTFVEANAEKLPFADRDFDAATIAFGIRNVPRIESALAEAFRVLKIGGKFVCLEFSAVDVPGLDRLYDLYSFNVIPALGRTVAGDAQAYRYLVESIRRFPRPPEFAAMLRAAGFARVTHKLMAGGIVAMHCGWRL
jgi:demethylmenaquinone methyltransferase / 2-methoxy-6-polyprenyl-1,4-benzoquinol methylase